MHLLRALGGWIIDLTETAVIGLSLFLIVYLFLVRPHQVNGQSMVPNFQSGEYLLTDQLSYRFRSPKRGEVIVFHAPQAAHCPEGTGCDFIKRVIGLPGDSIEIRDGAIYVNDQYLAEPYIPKDFRTTSGEYTKEKRITLGADEYFVVGDNRSYSSDSRAWGPIQADNIVGRAFFVYWPLSIFGKISEPKYSLNLLGS